eukprot:448926-Ditylum_brightwellii.AAC.1
MKQKSNVTGYIWTLLDNTLQNYLDNLDIWESGLLENVGIIKSYYNIVDALEKDSLIIPINGSTDEGTMTFGWKNVILGAILMLVMQGWHLVTNPLFKQKHMILCLYYVT